MRSALSTMFQSLPVASAVYRADALPREAAKHAQETVTLGREDRLKARARRRSDTGFEFATALARGTVLSEGDCFVFDAPPVIVRVVERPEPVLVIRPQTSQEWALFAYHIGNSHQPLMLADDGIVCPDVTGMEQVLTYHGIPFARDLRAFTPVGQIPDHQHPRPR